MMFIWKLLIGIVILFLVIIGLMLALSPGKVSQFVDDTGSPIPNSLSEKVFVEINGIRQGMFIQSKDLSNPVLLYLHGGLPDYFLTKQYPTGLEEIFTIVWWEQRGSGISYSSDIPAEEMTVEILVSDTIEVTNYLRERFVKDKIYLMGHSGGTFIGIQAAAERPELFYAYIGEAQMSYQLKSELLAYEYMLQQFEMEGNARMVQKLEANPVTMAGGTPPGYISIRDQAMHSLGIGTMRDMDSVISGIFFPSLLIKEYTLSEKVNLWRGKSQAGVSIVWGQMLTTDLSTKVPELKIPVYFIHGKYDYTCSYSLAKVYFEALEAPMKGFYTFEHSAHSPMFEEPLLMQRILTEDALEGGNTHADMK